jgi:hypothetical protein
LKNYPDGNVSLRHRRDLEPDMITHAPITTLLFGQDRSFILNNSDFRKGLEFNEPVKIMMRHGSLLQISHPRDTYYYQSIPKQVSAKGQTIILTFKLLKTMKALKNL